jgi:type IV pilus secretin PilQ/predicted competence protein
MGSLENRASYFASGRFISAKRLLVGVSVSATVLAFSACATRPSASVSSQNTSSSFAATSETTMASEVVAADTSAAATTTGSVSSRILRAANGSALGVELVDGEGFNRIVVSRASAQTGKTQASPLAYEVSRLENPARLVVDILGVPNRSPQSFSTEDSELVSRVRLGAHPEKSRIVLDLVSGEAVEHRIDSTVIDTSSARVDGSAAAGARGAAAGDELVITLARPGQMETARAVTNTASTSPAFTSETSQNATAPSTLNDMRASFGEASETTESSTGASTAASATENAPEIASAAKDNSAEAAASSTVIASAETVVEEQPAPNAEAPSPSASEQPRVVALSIDPVGPSENMIVAEVSGLSTYQLKRTAPSEYVLSIKGVEVDPAVATTLVAAPGTGHIRTVRPITSGENVLLRIFADPKVDLSARATENKIVVVAGQPSTDARAQMDPTTASDAAAKNEKKDAGEDKEQSSEVKLGAQNPADDATELDAGVAALLGEQPKYTGRLISLDLQDTDIDNALRIIAEVSNLNIIASDDVTGKVTLRLIDVPWDQALDVILKTNGLDKVQEGNVVRIAPVEKLRLEREALKQAQQAEEELEPMQVRYIRVSYAKAAELRPLVESVISERGSVAYDDRTNQLIVKDIRKGMKNVVELVSKLDLRTPQILLETQIVEANRNLLRSLGTELGFNFVQSPATGNATGSNFPNSVAVGGESNFPAATDPTIGGSAISFLLDSADATRNLSVTLNALEQEGRVRIVSRPAVATTNNTPATIKSVEKIRVKTPSGGTVVGVGQGSTPSSGGSSATESIEIGIVLEVTPQASPDYFVLLDLNAKSSTFGSKEVDGIPSEVERSATSSVLVSSGQTFAMGGIYRIIDRDTVTGIPFLKDIPVLGHLFRTMKSDNSDEELIFFVTPRIIEGSFDDAAMKVSL